MKSPEWEAGITTMRNYFAAWSLFFGVGEIGALKNATWFDRVIKTDNIAADTDQLVGGSDNIKAPKLKTLVKDSETILGGWD